MQPTTYLNYKVLISRGHICLSNWNRDSFQIVFEICFFDFLNNGLPLIVRNIFHKGDKSLSFLRIFDQFELLPLHFWVIYELQVVASLGFEFFLLLYHLIDQDFLGHWI